MEGELGASSIKLGLVCILAMGFFGLAGGRGGAGGIMPLERDGIWSFLLIWLVQLRDAAARYPAVSAV